MIRMLWIKVFGMESLPKGIREEKKMKREGKNERNQEERKRRRRRKNLATCLSLVLKDWKFCEYLKSRVHSIFLDSSNKENFERKLFLQKQVIKSF